jgi:predicted double-glycine peptidase
MRLKGPLAKVFGFSGKDHLKPGTYISGPIAPGTPANQLPFCRLDVPFVQQTHVNMCGDASVRMLVAYHKNQPPAPIGENPRGALEGQTTDDVAAQIQAAGLTPMSLALPADRKWTGPALAQLLRAMGPVACAGSMHFVVLTGVHENNVFLHDPWRGRNLPKTVDEFNRFLNWSDSDCMIVARR